MKMKRKQIGMLVFIAIIVILMVVTSQTPGTIADADSYQCKVYATILSLLPPVIAIGLALITKEVYTSLLAGIIVGGLLYSNFNLELMLNTILFPGRRWYDIQTVRCRKCGNFSIPCHAWHFGIPS